MTSEVENYSHLSRVWKIFSALSVASSSENPCRQMKTFQPTKYLLSCWRMSDLNSIHEAEYLDHLIKINLPRRILIVHPECPPSSIKLVHSFFSTSLWEWSGHQSSSKMMCACLSFSAGSPLLLMSVAIINSWNNSWEHLLLWNFSFWLMFLYLFFFTLKSIDPSPSWEIDY